MSLEQGEWSAVEYVAEFLRLSKYAGVVVAAKFDKCVRFEEGLQNELRVLIASQRERVFAMLVDKVKVIEEVKCTVHEWKE